MGDTATPASMSKVNLQAIIEELSVEFDDLFEYMKVAEGEINKAMLRHPQKRYLIYGAFQTLYPVAAMPMKLYRAHCGELLDRIGAGEDYQSPTRAEVLAALSHATGIIPLHNEPGVLYYRLFSDLFPNSPELRQMGEPFLERYEGETGKLYYQICDVLAAAIKRDAPYERVPDWEQEDTHQGAEPQQMPLFEEAS